MWSPNFEHFVSVLIHWPGLLIQVYMLFLMFLACTYLTTGRCRLTKNINVHLLSFYSVLYLVSRRLGFLKPFFKHIFITFCPLDLRFEKEAFMFTCHIFMYSPLILPRLRIYRLFVKFVDIYTVCPSYLFLYIETGNGKVITWLNRDSL